MEDPIVQRFLHSVLKRHGYQVVEAAPRSAVEMMSRLIPGVGVVITNNPSVFLPFAAGVALLYIAACPDYALAARFAVSRVLPKPFHPNELLEAVRELSGSL